VGPQKIFRRGPCVDLRKAFDLLTGPAWLSVMGGLVLHVPVAGSYWSTRLLGLSVSPRSPPAAITEPDGSFTSPGIRCGTDMDDALACHGAIGLNRGAKGGYVGFRCCSDP
jgi:hypothetical protein